MTHRNWTTCIYKNLWCHCDWVIWSFQYWKKTNIRCRVTATLWRPQINQDTASNRREGTKPTGTSYNFDRVWSAAPDGRYGKLLCTLWNNCRQMWSQWRRSFFRLTVIAVRFLFRCHHPNVFFLWHWTYIG